MKEIARFYDPEEAQIAAGFLRSQGIEVHVADVNALTAMPEMRVGLGGFRLMAEERDANLGQRLLADIKHEHNKAAPSCPKCGSQRIAKRRDIRFPLFHALAFVLFPFAPPTGELCCRRCKYVWRPTEDQEAAIHEHG